MHADAVGHVGIDQMADTVRSTNGICWQRLSPCIAERYDRSLHTLQRSPEKKSTRYCRDDDDGLALDWAISEVAVIFPFCREFDCQR